MASLLILNHHLSLLNIILNPYLIIFYPLIYPPLNYPSLIYAPQVSNP